MTPRPPPRLTFLVGAILTMLLASCGGSDPATGTLTATPTDCEIAEAAARCTVQVAWTSEGAGTLQLRAPGGGPASAVTSTGAATLGVPVGGGAAQLLDGDAVLASVMLTARCAERSVADTTGVCRPIPLQYADKVYAIYLGYPFTVGRERASPVDNRSRLALAEQTADCVLGEPHADSGRIGVVCATDRTGAGPWHRLYLDPLQQALFDDPDRLPADPPRQGPSVRAPVPAALAAFVANGTYFDKAFGVLVGPYVTFGPRAGDPGTGLCPGLPGCVTTLVPTDYYDYLVESRVDHYLRNSRDGGLFIVPKVPAPQSGTVPGLIPKDGYQGFACRTCPAALSPTTIRAYSHPG